MKDKYIISFLNDIELPNKTDNVELGNFIICNYSYLHNLSPESVGEEDHGYTYILYKTNQKVRTKHFENTYCKAIDEFMRLMLYYGGKRAFSLPDFSRLFKKSKNFYSTCEEISFVFRSNSSNSYFKKIKLNKSLFKAKGNNKILLDYIDNEPNTQIEKKIKLAVQWIGLSLDDRDLVESYIELCFALETLLTDKDQHPLERGLSYQLREFGAFLASDDYEDRISVQKEIKKLYGIRCAIVHQGVAPNLSEDDYYKLLDILKKIISKLFLLLEEKNIDNFIKLKNYIDKIKFS